MPMGQFTGATHLQHRFDFIQQFHRLAALAVQLVDEAHDGRGAQPAHFHQLDGALLHALGAVDHHQGGVHRRQRAVGVFGEILVARRVQQVDDAAVKGNCITEEVTEMPRCCSSLIQSEVAWRAALRPLTVPASWIAPPNSSSFSVSVVLPASGWEMMAKVLLFWTSLEITLSGIDALWQTRTPPGVRAPHGSINSSGFSAPLSSRSHPRSLHPRANERPSESSG